MLRRHGSDRQNHTNEAYNKTHVYPIARVEYVQSNLHLKWIWCYMLVV